jgi:hypothetical protein
LEDEGYGQRFLMVGFVISNAEPSGSPIREQGSNLTFGENLWSCKISGFYGDAYKLLGVFFNILTLCRNIPVPSSYSNGGSMRKASELICLKHIQICFIIR